MELSFADQNLNGIHGKIQQSRAFGNINIRNTKIFLIQMQILSYHNLFLITLWAKCYFLAEVYLKPMFFII